MGIKKKKVTLGLLYSILGEYMQERAEFNTINQTELNFLLGVRFHLKKPERDKVVKELIEYGFLERISRGKGGNLFKVLG